MPCYSVLVCSILNLCNIYRNSFSMYAHRNQHMLHYWAKLPWTCNGASFFGFGLLHIKTCVPATPFQCMHSAPNIQYNNIYHKRLLSYLSPPINSGTAGDTTAKERTDQYINKTWSQITVTYVVPSQFV